jgi:NitT/TauT family transport system substrate-binding protein
LRVGTNVWPGYEPLYLARDLDYLSDSEVRLVEYSSSSQVIRAFRNGAIDAAALTLDEVLRLSQDGFAPRVVLVMDISDGGDVIIGPSHCNNLNDLKQQRVGVENTALGAYILSRALTMAGMTEQDIIAVPLEANEHEGAFLAADVDAVVTFEPARSRLLKQGNKVLFDSSRIPGEIVDVLVIRDQYLNSTSTKLNYLVRQWFRALEYFQSQQHDAARRIAKRLQLTPEEVLDSYAGLRLPDQQENRRLLLAGDNAEPELLASARLLDRVMREHGLLQKSVAVEGLFPADANLPH